MAQIKVEFPSGDVKAAQLFGTALLQYAGSLDLPLFGTGAPPNDEPLCYTGAAATNTATDDNPPKSHEHPPQPVTLGKPNTSPPPAGEDDAPQVDTNGVTFNPDYCGKALDPFYSNGPQAGQWKKRRGVAQEDYDAWYAGELNAQPDDASEPAEPPPANTAAAFAPPATGTDAPPPPASTSAYGAYCDANGKPPGEFGTLMLWISELQTAGRVGDDVMNEARDVAGVSMVDLFAPSTPEAIARCIDKLAVYIESKAGQQ